jgi:hypothetical protein
MSVSVVCSMCIQQWNVETLQWIKTAPSRFLLTPLLAVAIRSPAAGRPCSTVVVSCTTPSRSLEPCYNAEVTISICRLQLLLAEGEEDSDSLYLEIVMSGQQILQSHPPCSASLLMQSK